mmetsp:Transcript_905/g.1361  ORF Transcript_905/g.1361 Transcript_905/m.1361 type:complete len:262 (+) Transcript_905:284-1069(+)
MTALLGGASQWDGQIFATNGEVHGNLVNTVKFPEDPFDLSPAIHVLSIERIKTDLAGDATINLFGPFAHTEPDTEEIQTRYVMYLPTFLAPHLLDVNGVTPRRLWEVVMPLLEAANKVTECDLFIDWMRVALTLHTRRVRATNVNVIVIARSALTVPLMDMELYKARETIINNDLTRRFSQGMGFNESVLRLAAAVVDNTNKTVALAAEEKERKPSKVWPQTIGLLMRYTLVTDKQQLPALYLDLAIRHQNMSAESSYSKP